MKIVLAIIGVVIIGVLVLGFLFVRWANSPEQVAAHKIWLQEQANKKIADDERKVEDEKRKVEIDKEFEAKRANVKLVIDEQFADNRFESLDFTCQNFSMFQFKDHQFSCSKTIYKNSPPQHYFIFSKDDFEDFAAEMDLGIWGDAYTGIFGTLNPTVKMIRLFIKPLILRRTLYTSERKTLKISVPANSLKAKTRKNCASKDSAKNCKSATEFCSTKSSKRAAEAKSELPSTTSAFPVKITNR